MWTWALKRKNKRWLWLASCRRTRQIVAYALGLCPWLMPLAAVVKPPVGCCLGVVPAHSRYLQNQLELAPKSGQADKSYRAFQLT